ncbi:MAG: S8 family peptidase [Eubacterium sp.]
MTCTEAIYSEQVLDYIVSSYIREETLVDRYRPTCYNRISNAGTILYREESRIDSQTINQFGYSAVPHVYGLMGYEALEATGVMQIRRQPYLDLYGQGVVIGFVDTGIDFSHEVFRNADGTTRIHSIWDQTIREGGPTQFGYGRVFTEEEINAALRKEQPSSYLPTRDENGHGTFLAGVAAGNEMPSKEFSGVAPLSQIVVVKCKEAKNSYREYYRVPARVPCYQENDIMTGIMYILQVANQLEKPVAICVGMGSNLGNHDGASPLCSLIDINNMAGASIVACSGNEGSAGHHYEITKKEEEIHIDVQKASLGFVCELWWQTPGSVSFDVISPGGSSLGLTRAEDGLQRQKRFTIENTKLEIRTGRLQGQIRDQVIFFRFEDTKPGVWKIIITTRQENPRYHMWLPISQFLEGETRFTRPNPDTTICEPANARYAITISAYNPVNQAFYAQSSRGFTPNGIIKPDVTAPGVEIYGPFPREQYGTMTGTSVAAAVTTGIAALFWQQFEEYDLNENIVPEMLIRGASPRGEEYPSKEWGYGTVNVYESITFE